MAEKGSVRQLQTGLWGKRQTTVDSSRRRQLLVLLQKMEEGSWVLGTEGPGFIVFKKYFNIIYISCVCLVPEEVKGYPRQDYEQLGVTMWVLGTEPESTARAARVFKPPNHLSNSKDRGL